MSTHEKDTAAAGSTGAAAAADHYSDGKIETSSSSTTGSSDTTTGGGSNGGNSAYRYDEPSTPPSRSMHWIEGLDHRPDDRLIQTLEELKSMFRSHFPPAKESSPIGVGVGQQRKKEHLDDDDELMVNRRSEIREDGRKVALWSCILGYCESLTTHKSPHKRYEIYPIPIDALSRLVDDEFVTPLNRLVDKDGVGTCMTTQPLRHRDAARSVSNWVWDKVMSKSNVRDEQHANSLYTCLRGRLDKKSVDCFGAALCTVAGLRCLGYLSILTLSEDHAYESHVCDEGDDEDKEGDEKGGAGKMMAGITSSGTENSQNSSIRPQRRIRRKRPLATCEVAIPGNTKEARSKRGREISETFSSASSDQSSTAERRRNGVISTSTKRTSRLTPETSWLYMSSNPVLCEDAPTTIAAALSNVNCSIEGVGKTTTTIGGAGTKILSSGPLFDLKRELLWILCDGGHLSEFPFALLELGDCEENRTSPRGETFVTVPRLGPDNPVLAIEALYHEAIEISKSKYDDGQVYPYCYPGHYHKDAGRQSTDQEYRLVEALRLYSEAARVASRYVYEWGDSLQLTKVMSGLAQYICLEILSSSSSSSGSGGGNGVNGGTNGNGRAKGTTAKQHQPQPRAWVHRDNELAACTWVLGFHDHLLRWEERTGSRFLPILTASGHKCSMGRALSLFSSEIRSDALDRMMRSTTNDGGATGACGDGGVGAGVGVDEASHGTTAATTATRKADAVVGDCRRGPSSSSPTPPVTATALRYYTTGPRSRRMAPTSPLVVALRRGGNKVSIGDMELAIITEDVEDEEGQGDGRSTRRSKRTRKSR